MKRLATEPRLRFSCLLGSIGFAISLSACGGGGSSVPPMQALPAVPTTPPVTGPPASLMQTVTLGAAQTFTFGQIASGASGSISFPATNFGQSPATISLQSTLPASVPAPSLIHRHASSAGGHVPETLGGAVTPLAYVVVNPSKAVSFNATPGLTFSFPAGALSGFAYLAFFDPVNPQLGWNFIGGAVPATGTSVTFAPQLNNAPPLVLSANSAYVFAIVANSSALPTPKPAIGTITEYPVGGGANAGLSDGIVTGPDGNLWLTENNANNIDKMTTAGAVTKYALPRSVNEGPDGITVGPDSNLWFTEYSNSAVGKISTSGAITEYALPTANAQPVGIAAGPDGNLWFTEYVGQIGKITPSGAITEYPLPVPPVGNAYLGPYMPYAYGMARGTDGNMWFTLQDYGEFGGNAVGKITANGAITLYPLAVEGDGPTGITAGPDGNMWFADFGFGQEHIAKITPSGTISEYTPSYANYFSPYNIAAGADGNLWVTDYFQNTIYKVTVSGTITPYNVPTLNSNPDGITSGPDHNIWFTEHKSGQAGKVFVQ